MKAILNLQEGQGLDVEVKSSELLNNDYSNIELRIEGIELQLYRKDAEAITYKLDKELYEESRSDLEHQIEKLQFENDILRNEKNDLISENEELRERTRLTAWTH